MRKIRRRKKTKGTKQVYCHECMNWVLADQVGFINLRTGRQGEPVLKFKCKLCNGISESAIFGRKSKPTSRKIK